MVIKDKSFEIFIQQSTIEKRVKELAAQLSTEYAGKELLFIPILNGAFLFAADLIKEITIPCQVAFIKVSSYQGIESTGSIKKMIGLDADIFGKNVVLIDDIVDTGLTMTAILEDIEKFSPASIKIATLLLKPEALQKQLELNYVGFTIPNNFVVGYGLDYEGYGRNLKDIYQLKS
jgi:hypoxanthine phosphoribosyltransferase